MPVLLAGQLPARHAMQFLIQRGQHPIQRATITLAGGIQQNSDVTSNGHCGQQETGEAAA